MCSFRKLTHVHGVEIGDMVHRALTEMTRRLIYILLIAVIGAMAVGTTSCKSAKMRDADEAYERGEYDAAANIYRKLYNKYKHKTY